MVLLNLGNCGWMLWTRQLPPLHVAVWMLSACAIQLLGEMLTLGTL
eukprot:gene7302-7912_t